MQMHFKKGIANFLIIIGLLGFVSTFFLIFLIEAAYQEEPQLCGEVNFQIAVCSSTNRYELTVNNLDEKPLTLRINGQNDLSRFRIQANNKNTINLAHIEIGSRLEITPLALSNSGVLEACNSKTINRQTNTIGRC